MNLGGVINGVRSFVPALLEQDRGYVVNTASMAGLTTAVFGAYSVTKHAVVALSEALSLELTRRRAAVGVSVLCPGAVRTRIADSHRNRPREAWRPRDPDQEAVSKLVRESVEAGMDPSVVADQVVDAIRCSRFYVLTHPEEGVGPAPRRGGAGGRPTAAPESVAAGREPSTARQMSVQVTKTTRFCCPINSFRAS